MSVQELPRSVKQNTVLESSTIVSQLHVCLSLRLSDKWWTVHSSAARGQCSAMAGRLVVTQVGRLSKMRLC